jgi:hypothetical protein
MSKAIWIPIACVLLTAVLGWGAWNTLATANATPEKVHKADVDDLREDIEEQQAIMVDQLQKIWEKVK